MYRNRRAAAALSLIATLLVSSCAGAVADKYEIEHEPAHVETPAAGGHPRVVMEESAVRRLGIETATVAKVGNTLVVPTAAVFVDPHGKWWVYINPEGFVYVREEVVIQRQAGDVTYLSKGPSVGKKVVTVGVPEVYGVEEEVGH